MATAWDEDARPANRAYGYPFGVDGVLTVPQAMEFLACSKSTLYRLMRSGKLRRGKIGPVVRICRRSIANYLDGIES